MESDLSVNTPSILYGEGDRLALLKQMLEALGHPDKAYKIIHIAGTNGKGSTASMIAAILDGHDLRTGLFTSPHLYTERESIQVAQEMITADEFQDTLTQVHSVASQLGLNPVQDLSLFETTFLIAMVYFAEQRCDYVVLETGLGGLLDATNAIQASEYAIFTKIGLDHIDLLGDTFDAIVETKAGIIRPNQTVIVAPNQKVNVNSKLTDVARELHSEILLAQTDRVSLSSDQIDQSYQINIDSYPSFDAQLGLKGAFQLENLQTVVTWYNHWLNKYSITFNPEIMQSTLTALTLPGRFERVHHDPTIILDVAHNVDAMEQFIVSLKNLYPQEKVTIVCGFLKDKDVSEIVSMLSKLDAHFIFTQPDHPERYLPANELKDIFLNSGVHGKSFADPSEALHFARDNESEAIFVVGSFYLIKSIRTEFYD